MGRMPDFEMPPVEPEAGADARAGDAGGPIEPPAAPPVVLGAGEGSGEPVRPQRWQRARVPIAAFVVGALVVGAGVLAADSLGSAAARAEVEDAVGAYATLVEAADGATLAADPRLDDAAATRALLLAGVAPVERATLACDEPRVGADLAIVDCDVRVERRVDPTRLVLERVDGRWAVTDGVEVPVRIRSGALVVEAVDGMALDPAIARGDQAAWLLPGRYDVAVRTPAQLEVERLEGLVVSASSGSVRWTSDTTATLDADVQATALAYLEACAASASEGCPPLQERPATDRFVVLDVVGRLRPEDPHAMGFDVSVARPAGEPEEFLVVPVRVDFGEDLDRYDVAVP